MGRRRQPIACKYNNQEFPSLIKRSWAIFFDYTKNKWEYKPKKTGSNGYTPDFIVYNVRIRHAKTFVADVWFDATSPTFAENKIAKAKVFSRNGEVYNKSGHIIKTKTPVIIVGTIPHNATSSENWRKQIFAEHAEIKDLFSFGLIDGDNFPALPCITKDGYLQLSGWGKEHADNVDEEKTIKAYRSADASCTPELKSLSKNNWVNNRLN